MRRTLRQATTYHHDVSVLHEPLLRWYDAHARDLPWRRTDATPWGVLVSELMLQQTPVSRVLPVYDAWLARWPHPADLAAEPAGEAIEHQVPSPLPFAGLGRGLARPMPSPATSPDTSRTGRPPSATSESNQATSSFS